MTKNEIKKFIDLAPGKVLANHMEALNHCSVTRKDLFQLAENDSSSGKLIVPLDGETIELVASDCR